MKRNHIRMALAALATCASAGTLLAQVPVPNTPPPAPTAEPQAPAPAQAPMPMTPPPRPLSFQVTGGMTIPAFAYADFVSDIGWNAQGALILRKGAFNSIRLEGEYNSVGMEYNSGTSLVYGGGIGGGRVVMRGNVQQEGYLVLGGYQFDGQACTSNNTCVDYSEFQFGTKFGTNLVLGHGKAKFVLDFHWLGTWSEPVVNMFVIGAGLRF